MTTFFEKINNAKYMLSGIDRINPHTGEYMDDGFLTDEINCIIDVAFRLYTEAFNSLMETYGEHHYRTQSLITEIGKMFISPNYSQFNDSDVDVETEELDQRANDWLRRNGETTNSHDEEFDIDQLNQRANDWIRRNDETTNTHDGEFDPSDPGNSHLMNNSSSETNTHDGEFDPFDYYNR